jgi:chorismate synthase
MLRRLRLSTAGESHGPGLVMVLEGMPAGLAFDDDEIARMLARRRHGYGRSTRQAKEDDAIAVMGGVRHGTTTGAPIAVVIPNRDHVNWGQRVQAAAPDEGASRGAKVTVPRPGHADHAGMVKYALDDARDVLERASARETAARTVAGCIAVSVLRAVGIETFAHVLAIGDVTTSDGERDPGEVLARHAPRIVVERASASPVGVVDDDDAAKRMVMAIDAAKEEGDTLGGRIEVGATGAPIGLGSYTSYDARLDARLAGALMSIPAVKAIELGLGVLGARRRGRDVHDAIVKSADGTLARASNRAGGVEGGVTNGEPLIARLFMKPLPTLRTALPSVDLVTGRPHIAHRERSDVCAVPAAAVVAESMLALVVVDALLERYGGDHMKMLTDAVARDRARQ